jgi:hypothetical protein
MVSNKDVSKTFVYSIVPISILQDKNLTALEKLILIHIISLCKNHDYCWATNKYFCNIYNVSIQTISKSIQKLFKSGYIISVYRRDMVNIEKRKIELSTALNWQIKSIKNKFNTSIQDNAKTGIQNNLNQ